MLINQHINRCGMPLFCFSPTIKLTAHFRICSQNFRICSQKLPRQALRALPDLLRRPACDDPAALGPAAGSHIYDIV